MLPRPKDHVDAITQHLRAYTELSQVESVHLFCNTVLLGIPWNGFVSSNTMICVELAKVTTAEL